MPPLALLYHRRGLKRKVKKLWRSQLRGFVQSKTKQNKNGDLIIKLQTTSLPQYLTTASTGLQCTYGELQLRELQEKDSILKGGSRETQRQKVKQKQNKKLKPLTTTVIANIKYSLTPTQININTHIKIPFSLVPIIWYITSARERVKWGINGYRVSFWDNGNVLEVNRGGGYTTLWMY